MLFYHITKRENVQSILKKGLYPSRSGLDGPGVYLWRGPLTKALSEADLSLSDNHYDMTDCEYAEFKRQLAVIIVTLPSHAKFAVEYPEYVVYKDVIPANLVACCGTFYDLVENSFNCHPMPLIEQIQSASARAAEARAVDNAPLSVPVSER